MSIDLVVANASPLICLCRGGLEHVLAELWTRVAIPEVVWSEILAGPEADPAARLLPGARWVDRVRVDRVPPQIAGWDLGPGESEVLTFALDHPGFRAIVDDGEARRCSRALGIPVLGTGAVLVLAKRRGLIPSVTEALGALKKSGLWISDEIQRLLLQRAGE
ncbi:MAG: DUF3368 domain-containing protein [Deferrisomatales bacterium]|nr:DUF3368 domain-containing protein [Deferrisomatales bacterium]